jgi:phosphoglycolate phosphatase-like HAD superfamily hydrolase
MHGDRRVVMIKAIIFDFDGVLVESVDIKTSAFARLFAPEGEDVAKRVVDYHLKHTGVSRFDKFRYIYSSILKRELTEGKFSELCDRFSRLVMDEVISAPYVKGGKEFLDSYCKAYKCFVASATPQKEIEEIIRQRGMLKYFESIYGSPKKKTDAVKDIIRAFGMSPEEVLYVGDAMSDYEAAASNHIHFIARMNGNEGIFSGIDCIKVEDLTGLDGELKKLAREK